MLKVLLPRMLKHEYIFESLKRNKLVAQAPRTALYSITSLGLLSTSLYLYPHEIIWVKSVVESFALSSEEVMLDKFVQLYLFQARKNFQEAIEIIFDSTKINYWDLLKVFWRNIDPTNTK